MSAWAHRHILDAAAFSRADIERVFAQAQVYEKVLDAPKKGCLDLAGKTVVTMFYENSTRTRSSFELAAKYLGAFCQTFDVATSSSKKGETLDDTIETLVAMGTDVIVLRHGQAGLHTQLAKRFGQRVSFLNAGDGCHQHPTQALLDAYTLYKTFGTADFSGRKITLVGDIRHSRVARSNVQLLSTLGADVHVVAPPTLMPKGFSELGCTTHVHLEPALLDADVVMALRIQLERQDSTVPYIASLSDYTHQYGLTHDRLRVAKPGVKVMHPMPLNRGVEMTSALADDPEKSLLFAQVRNGVLVRMALLSLVLSEARL
jgi:aspartate carbamoyltransferase catalytic subunit